MDADGADEAVSSGDFVVGDEKFFDRAAFVGFAVDVAAGLNRGEAVTFTCIQVVDKGGVGVTKHNAAASLS
jgi:hypothetical protein